MYHICHMIASGNVLGVYLTQVLPQLLSAPGPVLQLRCCCTTRAHGSHQHRRNFRKKLCLLNQPFIRYTWQYRYTFHYFVTFGLFWPKLLHTKAKIFSLWDSLSMASRKSVQSHIHKTMHWSIFVSTFPAILWLQLSSVLSGPISSSSVQGSDNKWEEHYIYSHLWKCWNNHILK